MPTASPVAALAAGGHARRARLGRGTGQDRSAVALLVALAILSVTLGLCYAFSYAAATGVQQSANLSQGEEAAAAAETGLEIALRQLTLNSTWSGESGTVGDPDGRVDTPDLRYQVTVRPDPDNAWGLEVTCVGQRYRPNAVQNSLELAARRTLVACLRRERLACSRYVLAAINSSGGGDVTLPSYPLASSVYTITGSVWANDDIANRRFNRTVAGAGYAHGQISSPTYFTAGAVPAMPRLARPTIVAAAYRPTYKLGDTTQAAYELPSGDITGGTFPPNYTGNAVGLCTRSGSLRLGAGLPIVFNGTLFVDGDLVIDAANVTIQARDLDGSAYGYDPDGDGVYDRIRFPAVVCTGAVWVRNPLARLIVQGSLYAGGEFRCHATAIGRDVRVTGGIVAAAIDIDDTLGSRFEATYDAGWTDHRAAPGCFRWVVSSWKD